MLSVFALMTTQLAGGYGVIEMAEERRAVTGDKTDVDNGNNNRYTELRDKGDVQEDTGYNRRAMGLYDGQDGDDSEGDEAGSSYTLSPDDEFRLQQRRERNRLAATRCRDRRRQRAAVLVKESDNLEGQNDKLMKDIAELEKEKQKLEETLQQHLPKCAIPRRFNQPQPNHPLPRQHGVQQQLPFHPHDQQQQPYPQQYYQHQLLQQQPINQVHRHPQQHCQPHQQLNCQPIQRYGSQYQQLPNLNSTLNQKY